MPRITTRFAADAGTTAAPSPAPAQGRRGPRDWWAAPAEMRATDGLRWVRPEPATRRGLRRLDRRTRAILIGAIVAAIVVNVGAAWSYWRITEPARQAASGPVELMVHGRSATDKPLGPGQTGSLSVTLTNVYDFPIKITRVVPGDDRAGADDAHRMAGCSPTGVSLSRAEFRVQWQVPRNTIGAFTIPDALTMAADARPACAGATFQLPIRVSGTRQLR